MIPLLLIAWQAVPAVPMPPPGGGSFSILARDPCPASGRTAADIIVCGRRQADDRVPQLRDEPPVGPVPSNPERTGAGALAASSTPCPARQGGCQVGFDLVTPALMLANEVRIGISKLADKRRDKSQRIPIALDGPGPQGHLEP